MIILCIRTDKPRSELALFNSDQKIDEIIWEAHRTLIESIHIKINEILMINKYNWQDIAGLACFTGPGSFTGLRIGLTVGNTLAYGLNIPIIGSQGDEWQSDAIKMLLKGKDSKIIVPNYGQDAYTTFTTINHEKY